ncbi:MAG: hypothetical protein JXR83_05625 [Deltaproteobacteria bacterium]|nr:hypothetical protein [Deltaproteobacteria bacterium]
MLLLIGLLAAPPLRAQAEGDLERDYRSQCVWFDEAELVAASAHRWLPRPAALQGEERQPLADADFYRVIGRDDLADQYRTNQALRWALIGVGAGLNALGLAAVAAGPALFAPSHQRPVEARCGDIVPLLVAVFGGSASALLGTGLWAFGVLLDPHPVDLATARELVDEHNKRLLGELKIDE